MTPALLAFFTLWAKPCEIAPSPPVVVEDGPWEYRFHSAWGCGHLYQVVESVYLPHGDTLNYVPLLDGERVWNAPNVWLSIEQ